MIAVVITLIIIVLLLAFVSVTVRLKGGEYHKITTNDEYAVEMSPSVSQIVLDSKYRNAVNAIDGIIKNNIDIPEIDNVDKNENVIKIGTNSIFYKARADFCRNHFNIVNRHTE